MYDVNKNKEELDATTSSKYYGQWETDKFIEKYFSNQSKGYTLQERWKINDFFVREEL